MYPDIHLKNNFEKVYCKEIECVQRQMYEKVTKCLEDKMM